MLILVPDTTSEPTLTDAPESARNGLSSTLNPTPESQTTPAGNRTPPPLHARVPAVAHGGTEGPSASGAAEPRNDARPSWGDLGYSRERVHPRAPSAQENQAAPRDISLFGPLWSLPNMARARHGRAT